MGEGLLSRRNSLSKDKREKFGFREGSVGGLRAAGIKGDRRGK